MSKNHVCMELYQQVLCFALFVPLLSGNNTVLFAMCFYSINFNILCSCSVWLPTVDGILELWKRKLFSFVILLGPNISWSRGKKWPTNVSLNYNTILQLHLFCKREEKSGEISFIPISCKGRAFIQLDTFWVFLTDNFFLNFIKILLIYNVVNFCCTAKWQVYYIYIYIFFSCSFPLWFITGHWI